MRFAASNLRRIIAREDRLHRYDERRHKPPLVDVVAVGTASGEKQVAATRRGLLIDRRALRRLQAEQIRVHVDQLGVVDAHTKRKFFGAGLRAIARRSSLDKGKRAGGTRGGQDLGVVFGDLGSRGSIETSSYRLHDSRRPIRTTYSLVSTTFLESQSGDPKQILQAMATRTTGERSA